MEEIRKDIEEIKKFAEKVMDGDSEYDGADGARDVLQLCKLYETLLELQNEEVVGSEITRVEVINETERAYVNWDKNNKVKLSIQDEGRTLKVFISKLN